MYTTIMLERLGSSKLEFSLKDHMHRAKLTLQQADEEEDCEQQKRHIALPSPHAFVTHPLARFAAAFFDCGEVSFLYINRSLALVELQQASCKIR